jgi:hypothetical protein
MSTKKAILASVTALLMVGTAHVIMAQTNVTPTNVVLDLDFNLITVAQGSVITNGSNVINNVVFSNITEATIIRDIGNSTSNTFSRRAELVLETPTNSPNIWSVFVRDGSNSTDVTGFFTFTPNSNSVGRTVVNGMSQTVSDTSFSIDGFAFHDSAGLPAVQTHFEVSGFTIVTSGGIVPTAVGPVGIPESFSAKVSGTGATDGKLIIIDGSISARRNYEVGGLTSGLWGDRD